MEPKIPMAVEGFHYSSNHTHMVLSSDGTDVTFSTSADADPNADVGFSHPRMRIADADVCYGVDENKTLY